MADLNFAGDIVFMISSATPGTPGTQ